MKGTLAKFKESPLLYFFRKYEKYIPILFFIGGFIFDSLTLGRIDRLYDLVVLCLHMFFLSLSIFLFNLSDETLWENTIIGKYKQYLPLAIQFFFGALSSAFVVYFSRSVSLSQTMSFFAILVCLLLANELFKKRISNQNLHFGVYSFISFTFFAFIIPVFIKEASPTIFFISGMISLGVTLLMIALIYSLNPTRPKIELIKLLVVVLSIYGFITAFFFLRLIPPVPFALDKGIVAHQIEKKEGFYYVTYETDDWYVFWRDYRQRFVHNAGEPVYVFTSIFAPTDLEKKVFHRWSWYNVELDEWEIVEDIAYEIKGGRNEGFRGYTLKKNVKSGFWKVDILTENEFILGVIRFEIVDNPNFKPKNVVVKRF